MGKNMRDRLFAILGIESGEESMVSMLLTQSVFLGIFFGAFDISAHSLFLSIFDEKMMARGYVVSGIAGIILTSVYTWLQTRMKFKNFAILNLIAVTSLTVILWLALILSPSKWVIFTVFLMLGPLNILAMLGFWGTTGRLFTLRQGKRLFGLVDAGLIIGVIISCYTIPVLLSFKFESHNILLLSALSIFIATIFQIIIGSRFRLVPGSTDLKSEKPREEKSVLSVFRKDKYTRIMGIFIALSVMTAFFVQYSFMAVTREQYPAEEDMARFLGIFTGSMMIFTLLVKLFVFSYLIRNYGLRICLAISPILVAGFTAFAILIGMFMGYTPESMSGFLIFFLLLALSRLFSKSLKDSIESPSFKVIYQTIDEKIRYEVQSGMDGTVNEIAALSSGLLLAGLGVLSFIKLIHFSWVLLFIILLWTYFAFKLYTEYRKSIRKALETVDSSDSSVQNAIEATVLRNRYSAHRAFRRDYFRLISGDHSGIENFSNNWYIEKIIDHSASSNDLNLMPVLRKISSNTALDGSLRNRSSETAGNLEKNRKDLKSENEKIANAKKMLSGTRQPQTTEILRLLRDNSIESKRYAVYIIGKFKLSDMLAEVCECLSIPGLESDAFNVLNAFGNEAVGELSRFYLVSSGNLGTSKIILNLLGKTCSQESQAFLFSRLWSHSRRLKEVAVKCLIDCDFKASDEDKDRVHQLISDTVGIMTWNLSAKMCLEKSNDTFLLDILKKEMNRWQLFLFNILSIAYDTGSINKIKENLERDTVESVNFALEMIDIVIDESIKPKVISLLDVIPDEAKLKNLFQFFPGEVPQYDKLLEDILNRDYNLLSLWTKASTLRSLKEIDDDDMAETVAALLFSPEGILQEESARLIARSSRELYRTVSVRIPGSSKRRLDSIVNGATDEKDLIFEKVSFLAKCFRGIPEEDLLPLSASVTYLSQKGDNAEQFADGCIIWPLSNNLEVIDPIITYPGVLKNNKKSTGITESSSYYCLPLEAVEDYQNHYPEKEYEVLKYIDSNEV
jgi:AAA family ATP:ADP antiporter